MSDKGLSNWTSSSWIWMYLWRTMGLKRRSAISSVNTSLCSRTIIICVYNISTLLSMYKYKRKASSMITIRLDTIHGNHYIYNYTEMWKVLLYYNYYYTSGVKMYLASIIVIGYVSTTKCHCGLEVSMSTVQSFFMAGLCCVYLFYPLWVWDGL